MWFFGKALQLAGLVGCTMALFWGITGQENAMSLELTGLAISFTLFYFGKVICEKTGRS